jgi:hypothetical protein
MTQPTMRSAREKVSPSSCGRVYTGARWYLVGWDAHMRAMGARISRAGGHT